MRYVIALVLLVFTLACVAQAPWFVPYTDGRVGGCMTDGRTMFGCTPQPPAPVPMPVPEPDPLPRATGGSFGTTHPAFTESERAASRAAAEAKRRRSEANARRNAYDLGYQDAQQALRQEELQQQQRRQHEQEQARERYQAAASAARRRESKKQACETLYASDSALVCNGDGVFGCVDGPDGSRFCATFRSSNPTKEEIRKAWKETTGK